MMNKRRDLEKLAKQQKKKYEYDSDEEMDPELGTWEHKLRTVEMDITRGNILRTKFVISQIFDETLTNIL